MTNASALIDAAAAAYYESIPVRISPLFADINPDAQKIWREIARDRLRNGDATLRAAALRRLKEADNA